MSKHAKTLCGPSELIAQLLTHRQMPEVRRQRLCGNVSDDGLRRLVMLSYFASQAVEEGRYPRFRVFVPPPACPPVPSDDLWQVVRFSEPVLLSDIDDLRRLAPSAASHDLALEVHERRADSGAVELACVGIRLAHSGEGATEVCSASLWARFVPPGLMIRIDGPGEIRASDAMHAWDLRAGHLISLGGGVPQPLAKWLELLARRLGGADKTEEPYIHSLHFAWHELLHMVSEQRRGGCLIVIPKPSITAKQVEEDYSVRLKYPTDGPDLGMQIGEFVASCVDTQANPDAAHFKAMASTWFTRRHRLLLHVETLSQVAGVDGCTVFDADLRLVGFGGKIDVQTTTPPKQLVNAASGITLDAKIMSKTGTRHLSAYQLCNAHAGVFCYVVSQDGHVTAFFGNEKEVGRWYPYWPWLKMSDHF